MLKKNSMKKVLFILFFSALAFTAFSQPGNPSTPLTKQDYLQKSKKQKTTAWILLGGGTIAWLAGASKYMNQNDDIDGGGEAAMVIGGIAGLSSIPFFIMASKNKKKAISLSFKNQMIPQLQKNSVTNKPVLSFNLKVSI